MAKIKLDIERRIGELDRRVFGGFIEHLGRCIYGGVFDEGSPLSDERGYRRDVLEAAKDLQIPILRSRSSLIFATPYSSLEVALLAMLTWAPHEPRRTRRTGSSTRFVLVVRPAMTSSRSRTAVFPVS